MIAPTATSDTAVSPTHWHEFADRVLAGEQLTAAEAESILAAPDTDVLTLLDAAYRVRHHYFGNQVQLYLLMNAKSGLCPEDCQYCSQSKTSEAKIPKYNILSRDKLMDGARVAAERQAKTYCIVISSRGPSEREMQAVETIVPEIKSQYDLKICASLGLLTPEQADRLKACGVDRVNHNLNTGEEYYGEICTTHGYGDRVDTLKAVRTAGMEMCSGGIIGMGEKHADLVQMAIELRELGVHSIPVNFFNDIEGTALENKCNLTPQDCLRALAMFRMVCPDREIRIAGGREKHLRSLQPLGLYPANSMFVGDYLTTQGQAAEEDYQMLRDLGFEVVEAAEARR
ncbi:biotin synthase BioB [Aeoliella mucimassa]|uniref:Biotin synthase n=1 Tax=Aeoliella mucimassa TaxID=2527972 RepID=A0A518AM62_9BACT|nr:biotin synthase BioB [Aeoliella mucimassa]QDU55815.1 Biotin synthase [Aeoliella mucimassa]